LDSEIRLIGYVNEELGTKIRMKITTGGGLKSKIYSCEVQTCTVNAVDLL